MYHQEDAYYKFSIANNDYQMVLNRFRGKEADLIMNANLKIIKLTSLELGLSIFFNFL